MPETLIPNGSSYTSVLPVTVKMTLSFALPPGISLMMLKNGYFVGEPTADVSIPLQYNFIDSTATIGENTYTARVTNGTSNIEHSYTITLIASPTLTVPTITDITY